MRQSTILIFFLAALLTAKAQYTDTGVWLGVAVDQKVNKDWNWSLKWENRWSMGGTWHDRGFVNAGVGYRLNKTWRAAAQLRWIERQRSLGAYESGRRFAFRLDGKAKSGQGEWKWRLMTTKAWKSMAFNEGASISENLVQRFRLGYARELFDRWTLVPSYEFFAKDIESGSVDWSTRVQVQLKHDINQQLSTSFAYVWSDEWQTSDPWSEHVIRFNINWRLPDFKIRKRKQSAPAARVYGAEGKRWSPPRQTFGQCVIDQLYLSEVHPKGKPSDFIELRSMSSVPCDLRDFSLTDDLNEEGLVFGTTILPPGGCWLGYEGGKESFSFGISAGGETIYLKLSSDEFRFWEVNSEDDKRSVSFDSRGNQKASVPSPGRSESSESED